MVHLMESLDKENIFYLRYPYPLFFFFYILIKKRKKCKLVTEHNTIEVEEFRLNIYRSFYLYFIDSILGKLSRQYADAIVGVTEEITNHEIAIACDPDKPHITIGNGIDTKRIKLRKPPRSPCSKLQLLCVASFSRWHGIDRIINGLADYAGATRVILHIVGEGIELENLKRLSNECQVENDVIFHGFLKGEALDKLFDMCHIAIGSLGIHRKGLNMTSELKIREYTARGIPFVCSAVDQDFPNKFPYIKSVPGDDSALDIEEIIRFAEDVYSDPEHHINMRAYAEENLDWSFKMKMLKEFCEGLVDG
jgi:glycosyltransferase involved in cell wall biosynthesis